MTIGIASFVTFRERNNITAVSRFQNYWPGSTVDLHIFYPFNAEAIVSNASGGQESITLDFATSRIIATLVENGLANAYFVECTFYQFVPTSDDTPPASKTVFASYLGELLSAEQNESTISIQIGSSLNPVEAQAPPRKFTTTLIGEPPKV